MKAFLVTLSSLCFCAILLCFLAYTTDRLPGAPVVTSSQQVEVSQVALNPDEVGVPPTMEEDLLCSPCVERMAFILEMVQEWEKDQDSRLETAPPVGGHVYEPPTVESVEARGWEGLSPEQREQAKQFFDQYGSEEGLRRFRERDPDAARQFERERHKPPVPSESGEEPSTR